MENLFLTIVGVICIVIVVFQVVFKFVIESRSFCGSSVYVIRNSRIVSIDCTRIIGRQALGASISQI